MRKRKRIELLERKQLEKEVQEEEEKFNRQHGSSNSKRLELYVCLEQTYFIPKHVLLIVASYAWPPDFGLQTFLKTRCYEPVWSYHDPTLTPQDLVNEFEYLREQKLFLF